MRCRYCHFSSPDKQGCLSGHDMDCRELMRIYRKYILDNHIQKFSIGIVGDCEPLIYFFVIQEMLDVVDDLIANNIVRPYTVTNGMLYDREKAEYLRDHRVRTGFSLDGPQWLHDMYRVDAGENGTYDRVIQAINLYREINNEDPSLNATVGHEAIVSSDELIEFFSRFKSRVTFSRMIGPMGISLDEYHSFIRKAAETLDIRIKPDKYDCTMYGGKCGAGINNIFYADGRAWICGNCIDLEPLGIFDTPPEGLPTLPVDAFDRTKCYHDLRKAGLL